MVRDFTDDMARLTGFFQFGDECFSHAVVRNLSHAVVRDLLVSRHELKMFIHCFVERQVFIFCFNRLELFETEIFV